MLITGGGTRCIKLPRFYIIVIIDWTSPRSHLPYVRCGKQYP